MVQTRLWPLLPPRALDGFRDHPVDFLVLGPRLDADCYVAFALEPVTGEVRLAVFDWRQGPYFDDGPSERPLYRPEDLKMFKGDLRDDMAKRADESNRVVQLLKSFCTSEIGRQGTDIFGDMALWKWEPPRRYELVWLKGVEGQEWVATRKVGNYTMYYSCWAIVFGNDARNWYEDWLKLSRMPDRHSYWSDPNKEAFNFFFSTRCGVVMINGGEVAPVRAKGNK